MEPVACLQYYFCHLLPFFKYINCTVQKHSFCNWEKGGRRDWSCAQLTNMGVV